MKPPPDRLATKNPIEETPHRSSVGRPKSDGNLESAPIHDEFKRFQSMTVPLELRRDWLAANAPQQTSEPIRSTSSPMPPPVDTLSQSSSILPPRGPQQPLAYDPDEPPTTTRRAARLQNKGRPWLWLSAAALTLSVTAVVLLLAPLTPEEGAAGNFGATPLDAPAENQPLVGAAQQQPDPNAAKAVEAQALPAPKEAQSPEVVLADAKTQPPAEPASTNEKTSPTALEPASAKPTNNAAHKNVTKGAVARQRKASGLDTKTPFAIDD